MTNPSGDREATTRSHEPADAARERVRYPEHAVIAVLDSRDQLAAATSALTAGGFLASEVHAHCGEAAADTLAASTGRTGLADLAVRVAERLGIENTEMEIKRHYEEALRDDKCVVRVDAPTDERKAVAARLLRDHGAHSIAYHGRFTIEGILPPSSE